MKLIIIISSLNIPFIVIIIIIIILDFISDQFVIMDGGEITNWMARLPICLVFTRPSENITKQYLANCHIIQKMAKNKFKYIITNHWK